MICVDFLGLILERELEHVFQEGVGLAHANGEIEFERHAVILEVHRQNGERLMLHSLEPAGERTPHGGDVEFAVQGLLHRPPRLMLDDQVCVVGLGLQRDIVDDAALGEGLADARGLEHADLQILELWIVKPGQLKTLVVAIGKHISRAIDGEGGEQASVIRRHVEHHVAHALIEGLPCEAALDEGAPRIGHASAHGLAEQRRQLILEALLLDVGERHVAGVGTDIERAELLRLVGGLGRGSDGDLLARGEIIKLFAQVALEGSFCGVGCKRRQGKTGNAKRRHQDTKGHGGSGFL